MRWCLAFGLTILLTTAGWAQSLWQHNGSLVRLEADGPRRKFVYEQPRAGLPVQNGTTLFVGKKTGPTYVGKAFVFSERCGAVSYDVSGPVSDDLRTITLQGRMPMLDTSCRPIGARNDTLVFIFQESSSADVGSIPVNIPTNAVGLHIPVQLLGTTIHAEMPSDEHLAFMLEDVLTGWGLQKNILLLEKRGLKNGFATTWVNFDKKEVKIILFDPVKLGHLRASPGATLPDRKDWLYSLFTITHEIGHHVCGHLSDQPGNQRWKEVEADHTAGAILAQTNWREYFGRGRREEFEEAMRANLTAEASETHPGINERLAAFRAGWSSGRKCK